MDQKFEYVPSYLTDIRKTFARHGWIPPSELKAIGMALKVLTRRT